MMLTTQDKNEFLKAALKSKDPGIAQWLVSVVDSLDALPDGKNGITCPPYALAPSAKAAGSGQQQTLHDAPHWPVV